MVAADVMTARLWRLCERTAWHPEADDVARLVSAGADVNFTLFASSSFETRLEDEEEEEANNNHMPQLEGDVDSIFLQLLRCGSVGSVAACLATARPICLTASADWGIMALVHSLSHREDTSSVPPILRLLIDRVEENAERIKKRRVDLPGYYSETSRTRFSVAKAREQKGRGDDQTEEEDEKKAEEKEALQWLYRQKGEPWEYLKGRLGPGKHWQEVLNIMEERSRMW